MKFRLLLSLSIKHIDNPLYVRSKSMAPSIPDRWIPYKACGNIIEGTRFICFKVPLRKSVQSGRKDIREIWDIPKLLEKIPNLGAVIDLTDTFRYYDPKDLQDAGVIHRKIRMPGRIEPPENKVREFMDAVDEFLNKDDDFLIGVHCTHGLNRTGYMVCRYMRDRLRVPANEAIKKFEKARGYRIERKVYISSLLGESVTLDKGTKERTVRPVEENEDEAASRSSTGREGKKKKGEERKRKFPWKRPSCESSNVDRRKRKDSSASYDYKYDY